MKLRTSKKVTIVIEKPLQLFKLKGFLVPRAGIEPALPKELDFESSASTNSATEAFGNGGCKFSEFILFANFSIN